MKSTRLEQIDGHFHGIHFTVRPTPIAINKIDEERRNMLRGWYKQNCPDVLEALDNKADEIRDMKERVKLYEDLVSWMEDEEFRAKYAKFMADKSMAFDSPVPDEVWTSETLEYSTIEEAWDFFCGKRKILPSGR